MVPINFQDFTVVAAPSRPSSSSPASFYNCLKQNEILHFIAGYNSGNTNGTYVGALISQAKAAGLSVSAYYAFNGGSSLSNRSIDTILSQVRGKGITKVCLDIKQNAGGDGNVRNFYQRVCVNAGYSCGTYTNHGGMSASGLGASDMAQFAKLPLWYADESHFMDPSKSLGNFYDWTQSHGRQIYLSATMCGTSVDLSIMENSLLNGGSSTIDPVDPVDPADPIKPVSSGQGKADDSTTVGNLSGDAYANIRNGPGSKNGKIGTAADGETIQVTGAVQGDTVSDDALGSSSSTWYKINFSGQTGYVSALYALCN